MSLLIKGGEIVTAESQYVADIHCESETITRIARNIDDVPADEVIDATGKVCVPRVYRSARPYLSAVYGDGGKGHA